MGYAFPEPSHGACCVLIVDDDRMQIELMSVFLMQLGLDLRIRHALTIDEAANSISDELPDIVFLDNHMPPELDFRNGFELLRGAGYLGPIIVNSVSIDEPVLRDAGTFGVTRVVDKFDLRDKLLRELIATYWPGSGHAGTTMSLQTH